MKHRTFEETDDWILEVAGTEAVEPRDQVLAYLDAAIGREPDEARWHQLVGYASFHLWHRPRDRRRAARGIVASSRALVLEPDMEFARLYRAYLAFDAGEHLSALADCRTLDRDYFSERDLAWRLITADEIEFACMVGLGAESSELAEVARWLVALMESDLDGTFPVRPQHFLDSVADLEARGVDVWLGDRTLSDSLGMLADRGGWRE